LTFLLIQTAFLGDVILATAVAEKLHRHFPEASIDFLLRKGNEGVLENHPFIRQVIVLDKKKNKLANLLSVASQVKRNRYDQVINLHRFASSGFIVWRSGAREKTGFDKNPFSFFYTKKFPHAIGKSPGQNETERNHQLIAALTDSIPAKPRLYPSLQQFQKVEMLLAQNSIRRYVTIAPASIWFTKQLPAQKWVELIRLLSPEITVYLVGAGNDLALCEKIKAASRTNVIHLAGQLSLLETAALMKSAEMNYVNDSAPMHIASAMEAPTTAVFCSTVPAFGFGPLAEQSKIVETKISLDCRPCGLHGYRQCPQGHFRCASTIDAADIVSPHQKQV
jgi:heptosyltransferase-2